MTNYRTGSHWGTTIIRVGTQPADANGKRPDDELMGMITDPELAERVCGLLNAHEFAEAPDHGTYATCAHCGDGMFPIAELEDGHCGACVDDPERGEVGP